MTLKRISMSRFLVTSILADNRLTLEWEEDGLVDSHDRHRLEKLLFNTYEQDAQAKTVRWLLVLGLSDKDISLALALEFWRTLAQKGQVAYWYKARLWHCWSTNACAAGARTRPAGRVSRSRSSMTGPSTKRRVLKKALITNFIRG